MTERVSGSRTKQTGIGLTETTLARLDRLRAVLGGKPRGWVVEHVLNNGSLDDIEEEFETEIKNFNKLAKNENITWEELAEWYAASYQTKTYPPSLDELAAILHAQSKEPNP